MSIDGLSTSTPVGCSPFGLVDGLPFGFELGDGGT